MTIERTEIYGHEYLTVSCLLAPDDRTFWVDAADWAELPKGPDGQLDPKAPLYFVVKNMQPGRTYLMPSPATVRCGA